MSLTMVVIGRIDTTQRQGISVHEWWDKTTSIAVLFDPTLGLKVGQTIDIEGLMTTLPSRSRAVVCERIAVYLDRFGYVVDAVPPLKGLFEPSVWPFRGWIPVQQAAFSSMSALTMTPLSDPEPPGEGGGSSSSEPTYIAGTIPWAKSLPDGAPVALIGQIVTAATGQVGDCIYIEEQDRSSGMRVVTESPVAVGDVVELASGTMDTTSDGERFIAAADVQPLCTGSLQPSGMINRDIGGWNFVYDSEDGSGQRGVVGGKGLNNIGSLVKTWGKVTCEGEDEGGPYVYVDDGSALMDGTQTEEVDNIGVRVVAGSGATLPEFESIVELTGISSCTIPSGEDDPIRLLRIPTPVIHVMTDGDNQDDGLSWATAKRTVTAALLAASFGQEIWVAEGRYTENITLEDGVGLYGGFSGDELYRHQRDLAGNDSILDGDQGGSVVTCPEGATQMTIIDGFTIEDGSGTGSEFLQGGGIYCKNAAPVISHNTITANGDVTEGGGIYCESCSGIEITDNVIANNQASVGYGGGIYVNGSSGVIVGNTIVDNYGDYSGGIYCQDSTFTIANNIVAYNSGGGLYVGTGGSTLHNNCVYGNYPGDYYCIDPGSTDIPAAPSFVDYDKKDYHLAPNSPCINAGDNSAVASGADIDCQYRIQSGVVDIGADEVNSGCVWYNIALSAAPIPSEMGTDADVTAIVYDPSTGARISGVTVSFSVDAGTLGDASVSTDDGVAATTVTRTTMGYARVTATVPVCGNDVSSSECTIWFYDPDDDNWPMFQHDIAHTGVSGCSLTAELEKKWQIELTGHPYDTLWSSPVVVDGWVYVGTNNSEGTLYAVRVDNTDLCTRDLDSPIHGTPCIADGRVYIGTEDGILHVLYAGDQQGHDPLDPDWTFQCDEDDHIYGSPVVYDGAVYFGTSTFYPETRYSGRLYTVDLTTRDNRISSPTTIHYGVYYPTPGIDESFSDGARCYISDDSCYVSAAECDTGLKVWEWYADLDPMLSSPVAYNGYVFVGSGDNRIYRIEDGGPGVQAYDTFSGVGDAVYATVAALDGKLYFGCEDQRVYCVDSGNLTQVWRTDTLGSTVTSSTAISVPTAVLFTASSNGRILALDAETGDDLWEYNLRYLQGENWSTAQIKSSPAIGNDRLFVVAGDDSGRRLYCFGP